MTDTPKRPFRLVPDQWVDSVMERRECANVDGAAVPKSAITPDVTGSASEPQSASGANAAASPRAPSSAQSAGGTVPGGGSPAIEPIVMTAGATDGTYTISVIYRVWDAFAKLREALAEDRGRIADRSVMPWRENLRRAIDALLALDVPGRIAALAKGEQEAADMVNVERTSRMEAEANAAKLREQLAAAEESARKWKLNFDLMANNADSAYEQLRIEREACDAFRSWFVNGVFNVPKSSIASEWMRAHDARRAAEKNEDQTCEKKQPLGSNGSVTTSALDQLTMDAEMWKSLAVRLRDSIKRCHGGDERSRAIAEGALNDFDNATAIVARFGGGK